MKIVIVGTGEVGAYLCSILSHHNHDVTVIEMDTIVAQKIDEEYNVKVVVGNGSSAETLIKAEADQSDFFLAMTSDDKTNLISSSLAKVLGSKTTITRIHDQTYSDNSYVNYQHHFGIDYLLNPEGLCAVALAKSIRNPGRVAVENFARGNIEVQQTVVKGNSKLIGKHLRDIRKNPNVRIGYIQRDEHIEVANSDSTIEENDLVTLFGHPDALYLLKSKLDPECAVDIVRVVLLGGSETAIALVRLLTNPRFKIRIIESDTKMCHQLAQKFPHITVINGDATSLRLLEEEQIDKADYFIGCTKKDEINIMTGLQASKLGVKHVQIVINKTDYESVIDRLKSALGFELTVSPRVATVSEIMRYIDSETYTELATLPGKAGKILEIHVTNDSPSVGKTIMEIEWPRNSMAVALLHKFNAIVPKADDKILGGDRIVVITHDDNINDLLALLR